MRGLISPTSQHCRENVLDTGSHRLDRDSDAAGRRSNLEKGGGSCPCSGSRDNTSSPPSKEELYADRFGACSSRRDRGRDRRRGQICLRTTQEARGGGD